MLLNRRARAPHPVPLLHLVPSPSPANRDDLSPRLYAIALVGAVGVAFLVRLLLVLSSSFPLNDGGMFYAMVRDLQASGYRLPSFTSYNSAHVPYVYSPLGFYLAGAIDDFTPVGLIDVFRFVPPAFSTLTVAAFFLLARDVVRSRVMVVTAVLFFGLLPPAFTWMIMGGGLTRAMGFLFAILTVREVRLMYLHGHARRVPVVALLAALAVLSHIEMAWFACVTVGVLFVAYGRDWKGVLNSSAVAVLTLLITAPWWALAVQRHGLSPMMAAAHSTQSSWWHPIALLVQFDATGEPLFALLGALVLLGVIVCLKHREYLLPSWLVAVAFLDQRGFLTSSAVVLSLLAAIGFHRVVLPVVTERGGRQRPFLRPSRLDRELPSDEAAGSPPRWLPVIVIAVVATYPVLSAIASTPGLLVGLSADERAAMTWARGNTPPSSQFIVISGRAWPVDRNAEWFPVIAGRTSVATVQGYEWFGGGRFERKRDEYRMLQACANADASCLQRWSDQSGLSFDYVYIATVLPVDELQPGATCCDGLRIALRHDPRYTVAYDGPGATIFRRTS